ncbi:MAG: hypothetical protein ACQESQ_12605 [Bacteroidota bacterium]
MNIFTCAQDKCAEDLEKQIKEYAKKNHSKVALLSTPGISPGYNYHLTQEDLKNNKKTNKNFKTLWSKGRFRFYIMSSEKHQNDAVLKIYEGDVENQDSLIYELKDEADDNKPSYIDVDLKKSPGKYLLKFQFKEQKEGCVAFLSGIFKDGDYYSQQKD